MDIAKRLNKNHHLSDNDKVIVEYMLEHLEEIPQLSSREFAKRTYTSATSIVRFVRKLGYTNYNDFKYHIISALKNVRPESYVIKSNDDILMSINKISQMEVESIQYTKEHLHIQQFQEIIQLISQTKYIDIIANDTNATIGQYASHCLSTLGKIVTVYSQVDLQIQMAMHVPDDHIVIIISKHSLNKHILNTARTLKKRHIKTIVITSQKDNELTCLCDYTVLGLLSDKRFKSNELEFFTSLKYIFDLMFGIMLSRNYEKSINMESIYNEIFFEKL